MPWYRHLLWPFAILYGIGAWVRNRLFDLGVLSSKEFDVPIICVGNLEAGGTGKSPLVNYIVQILANDGRNVAILSRGYGRKTIGFQLVNESSSALEVGDEPLQLKRRFRNADVAVCEDRVKGIGRLMEMSPKPDVIVMDDGFQHRWVKPSLSILVTPSMYPLWKNHLLPVGTLREPKSERQRADLLVISGSEETPISLPDFDGKTFHSKTVLDELIQFSGQELGVSEITEVVLFSGIANEERFEKCVRKRFQVRGHLKFSDHHNYTVGDLSQLGKLDSFGAAVNAVITTEKDAARLANSPVLKELNDVSIFYLPINIEFAEAAMEFDKMILDYGKHA